MADGVGGMVVVGGIPHLTLSSLAVLAFHGGGAGAGAHGQAGDGRDILLGPTAPNTVTTADTAMEIPGTVMGMATDRTPTAPNMVTTVGMAMEILATVTETVTDLAPAMQVNTARQLDRG